MCVYFKMHHQCRRKCQISITEQIGKQNVQIDECHLIYTLFMNSKSLSLFSQLLPEGTTLALYHCQTSPHTEFKMLFSILNYVSSSTVGRRWPISRLGGAPERHPDVVAPHHCQALPHTAVWVLQPRHPGGSSWGSAEPGRRQLEGNSEAENVFQTLYLLISPPEASLSHINMVGAQESNHLTIQ